MPPVGDINHYGKFGLWHDCLYMGTNSFNALGSYDGAAFASFSRPDLYSGAALTYSLGWLPPSSNAFTMVPSNNQGTGANAAQPGTPNYFVSESSSNFGRSPQARTAAPVGRSVRRRTFRKRRTRSARARSCRSRTPG